MGEHLIEFWTSISASYFSWIGLVSTVAWIAGFAPGFRNFVITKSHPAIWRYGLGALSIAMFSGAAFNAFHIKSLEAEGYQSDLKTIQQSAEGMISAEQIRFEIGADPSLVGVELKNSSQVSAIQLQEMETGLSVNDQKFPMAPIPNLIDPVPPLGSQWVFFQPFPRSIIKGDPSTENVDMKIKTKYGRVGLATKYELCLSWKCSFKASELGESSPSRCVKSPCAH